VQGLYCPGSAQGLHKVCTGSACTESAVQDLYRVCLGSVQPLSVWEEGQTKILKAQPPIPKGVTQGGGPAQELSSAFRILKGQTLTVLKSANLLLFAMKTG